MSRAWALLAILGTASCIQPPNIVMVDRGTALERQASGSFDDVERRLNRAAIETPAPLTAGPREAVGMQRAVPAGGASLTDADQVDALLVQHCIGEGADGLLVETPDACRGVADADQVAHAIDSVNRARHQVWAWMQAQRADMPRDEVRRGWQKAHAAGVVCGGWIQGDDGKWQGKSC